MGGDPEAPAALRPAVAEPGILMDVRFIEVDQQMPVVLGTRQQIPELLDEGLPPPRVGPAEQLLGLLPRQPQAWRAARIVSRQRVRPNASSTQPTRRRRVQRGAGSAPATGAAAAACWAARTTSPRPASISAQRGAAAGAPVSQRLGAA